LNNVIRLAPAIERGPEHHENGIRVRPNRGAYGILTLIRVQKDLAARWPQIAISFIYEV
jgi:hypothetical protein